MPRAHVYKVLQNADGSFLTGASVRVLPDGGSTDLTDPLYTTDAGSSTLTNPFTSSDGKVEFYLDNRQRIQIGITPPGSGEFFITVDAEPDAIYTVTAAVERLDLGTPIVGNYPHVNSSGQIEYIPGGPGTPGSQILSAYRDPVSGDGVNGDWWINKADYHIFGPKTGGGWPTGYSLVGPQGPAGVDGTNGVGMAVFGVAGVLTIGSGVNRFYNDTGRALTIGTVRASVGTAPTTSDVTVDVNLSGTSIFTTNPLPDIAVGSVTATATPNTTTLPTGGYLTVDIDATDGVAANLVVQISLT